MIFNLARSLGSLTASPIQMWPHTCSAERDPASRRWFSRSRSGRSCYVYFRRLRRCTTAVSVEGGEIAAVVLPRPAVSAAVLRKLHAIA